MDILLPYVDMEDPAWQEVFLKAKHLSPRTPRMREVLLRPFQRRFATYGLFKYWFRALERNYRGPVTVHLLLMQESQRPQFLKEDPSVVVHYHRDFIPGSLMPCFNSNVIELCAMKELPLTPVFLLANDDMYFNQPCCERDFADGDVPLTQAVVKGGYSGSQFQQTLENGRLLVEKALGRACPPYAWHHLFQAYQDRYVKDFLTQEWPSVLPRLSRWRGPRDVTHFMIMAGQILSGVSRHDPDFPINGYFDCSSLTEASLEALEKPKAICLNDSGGAGIEYARSYLSSRYPEKSRFEV